MSQSKRRPLKGDPTRQAVDTLRGFAYQIWRSVERWVTLPPGHALFLEGAEDLDRLGPDRAETEQVKALSGNVTLVSLDVLESILNFWEHQTKNPDHVIDFRFLTTARRGKERTRQLGAERGLDVWDRCRDPGCDTTLLRTFLAPRIQSLVKPAPQRRERKAAREARETRDALIATLHRFLTGASDEELREKLIRRITWDTGNSPQPEIELRILEILQEHGARSHSAPPAESDKVLPHLLKHAWEVVVREDDRWLTYADFLKIFESVVAVSVPRSEYQRLRQLDAPQGSGALAGEPPATASWYADALKGMHRAARDAFVTGGLDEAETTWTRLLEEVRRTAPAGSDRGEFEQGLLLSLGQAALRRDQRRHAEERYREAEALGPFDSRNRYLAGWLLLNLGRHADAIARLDPDDGTPAWRSALGIALLASGDEERFRAVCGDERDVDEPDLLLALVRHHAGRGDLVRADHAARRLVRMDDGTPEGRFRAIEAGSLVFSSYAWSDERHPVDAPYWIAELRRLFSDADTVLAPGAPVFRHIALRRRLEFHRTLLETEPGLRDFHALVTADPADAAHFAAVGMASASAEDLAKAAEAARDPVERALIEAEHLVDADDTIRAAERLEAVEPLADGAMRDLVIGMRVELRAMTSADQDTLLDALNSISDPVSRATTHAAVLKHRGDWPGALAVLNSALEAHPASLRLLRVTRLYTRYAATDLARAGTPDDSMASLEVELAEALVERLPCPEHRVLLAWARARSGDVEGALRQVREVEDSGYRTHGTTRLLTRLTLHLRRFTEHAEAARKLFESFDPSPSAGLDAAQAAIHAGDYTGAETLLKRLVESEDREVAMRAYAALAFAVEAQGKGVPAAREEAVRILLAGYDRLGGPAELAGPLFVRSLETRYAREVGERIARDHGSFASLPGVVSLPVDEAIEMMRRDLEGAKLRTRMFAAGVIPFETYAQLGPRRSTYLWFSYRLGLALLLIDPPRILLTRAGLRSDQPNRPLLLDRTALLTLAEIGLIREVLDSPLTLWLGRETFDWLSEEHAQLIADYRPGEHERLRGVIASVEDDPNVVWTGDTTVDEGRVTELQKTLSWGDAYELTLAERDDLLWVDDFVDLETVPERCRDRVVRSADLLLALVNAGHVGYGEAYEAEHSHPSSFRRTAPRSSASPDRPLLLSWAPLEAWQGAGLLSTLARVAPRVVVSPLAERQVRQALAEQEAYSAALRATSELREGFAPAVEAARVRLLDLEEDELATGADDEAFDASEGATSPVDGQADRERLLRGLLAPLDRVYAQALSVGATVWSDDTATHLYRDLLGPLLPNVPDVQQWAATLRMRYPEVSVVGTPDVLLWMRDHALIHEDERQRMLVDLVEHGRAVLFDAEVIASDGRASGEAPGPVLRLLSVMPGLVPPGSVARFVPNIMLAVSPAIGALWGRPDQDEAARRRSIQRVLDAVHPWLAADQPFSRFAGHNFWLTLTRELLHSLENDPAGLVRLILSYATERGDFEALLAGLWPAIDSLDHVLSTLPPAAAILCARVFVAVARGAASLEVYDRPLLPFDVLRLASQRFGVDFGWTRSVTVQRDEQTLHCRYILNDAEARAAADLEATIAASSEAFSGGVPAEVIETTVEAELAEGGSTTIPVEVELLHLLGRVGPAARAVVIASLAAYQREAGAPELAELIEAHAEAFSTDDPPALEAAQDSLFRRLLDAPRFWADHDPYQAFNLLRSVPLEYLRTMAGMPEPWRPGESLLERVTRLRPASNSLEEWLREGGSRWGPFLAAVLQWRALMQLGGISEVREEEVRWLVFEVVHGERPYAQITAYGFLLALLNHFPELRDKRVGSLTPEAAQHSRSLDLAFDGTFAEFARGLLAAWLRAELAPPELSQDPTPWLERAGDEPLWVIAGMHHLHARLHAVVTRLVYRAVLSDEHLVEAAAPALDETEADPVAELLHVGHRLVDSMYMPLLAQARARGIEPVIREVERVATQYPLSEPRVVVDERFAPEVIGVGPEWVNPYLSYLLAMFEVERTLTLEAAQTVESEASPAALARSGGSPGEPAGPALPIWWSAEVADALRELATRAAPTVLAYIENVGQHAEAKDRFQSLLTEGIETRAHRLLTLYETGVDAPDVDEGPRRLVLTRPDNPAGKSVETAPPPFAPDTSTT